MQLYLYNIANTKYHLTRTEMKYLIKRYLLLVFLITSNVLNAQDTIKVGIDNNYPPYEFLDNAGNPTGPKSQFAVLPLHEAKPYL